MASLRTVKIPCRSIILPRTKIPNLYFTGQNLNIHGILGTTVSAFITCSEFIGFKNLITRSLMPKRRSIRVMLYILTGLLVIIIAFYIYYRIATRVSEPEIANALQFSMQRTSTGPDEYSCEHGWLRKAREGWWEMYLEGSPYEIGYAHGLLTKELNYDQEKAFLERLGELIPSKFYQKFHAGFCQVFQQGPG